MKRELIFYAFSGAVLGRTGEITALYTKEYYNAVGTFEAHFPASSEAGKILLGNDFIIAVGDGFEVMITSVTVNATEIVAYGRTLNWILGRRLCAPFGIKTVIDEGGTETTEAVESEAAELAEARVSESWGGCMAVTASGITGHKVMFSKTDYTPCGDIVTDVLAEASLGHRVDFSPKTGWSFTVFEGAERQIILSRSLKNAANSMYTKDLLDRYNVGYTEGELTHSDDITDWETAVDNTAELEKHKTKKGITAEAIGLVCGKDYNLGDIIRVTEEFCGLRFTSRLRAAGVERWAEYNDAGEKPILEEIT